MSPKPEINSILRQCVNLHADLGIFPNPWVTLNFKRKDQDKSIKFLKQQSWVSNRK